MESDLLALHWMEHSTVFSQAIGNLRSKTSYTDATLACEGHFYPVHKFVLSTCSQYFNAIFEWTPCINPVVVINNVTPKELEALLDFMYIGEVNVKDALIPDIMRAAECLRIRGLSLLDDDSAKSNLKKKSKTESVGPARKRRRTSVSKKKVSAPVVSSVPSTSQPQESKCHVALSQTLSASAQHVNNEGNSLHVENHSPDVTTQPPQRQSAEPEEYEPDLTHAHLQNNAPSAFLPSQLSPPQPHITAQPLQSSSNAIINQHSKVSPYVPTPSYSSALDLTSNESSAPMHPVASVTKPDKMELEENKPHIPEAQDTVASEEIPTLLDSFVGMQPQYDTKVEPGEETATLHAVEPNEKLYEFSEDQPSASGAPSYQEVQYQKGPATSSSCKVNENSTEANSPFKCSVCDKQYLKKESLRRHLRTHTSEPYTCKQCPFSSAVFKELVQHRKKEHSVHHCSICDFTTHRIENLRRHVARHQNQKSHRCPECKYSTARLETLQKHIKNKHEKK